MSSDDALGPAERLHPFYLLTGLGRSVRGMIGGYYEARGWDESGFIPDAKLATLGLTSLTLASSPR